MNFEKFEKIEALLALNEDLLLQEIQFKAEERNTSIKIKTMRDNIISGITNDLSKAYMLLDFYLEQHVFCDHFILAIDNNRRCYQERLQNVLGGK